MITERWFQLQAVGSVVFVVDASDGGTPCLAQAYNLLRQLARMLPNIGDHRLMFLGGSEFYSAADMERQWTRWVRENAGRLSVLTPVYEALVESSETIVMLAAFRIFDLPDWRDTPQLQRTLFVRLGETSLGETVKMHAPDAHTLRTSIQRTPIRVEIGGDGLIPTYWDNPAFTAQQSLRLQAERNGHPEGCQAILAFAGRPTSRVLATATFEDGSIEDLALEEVGLPLPYQDWTALPPVEAQIVRDCLERKEYACPYCGGSHPADELTCGSAEQSLPLSVLPSLAEQRVTGFVLVRIREDRVEYRPQGSAALRLGRDQVALRNAELTQIHRFDAARGAWVAEPGEFKQFHPVPGGDAHAIIL